jgi:regulator of protease activity HflC (stomatin/prohibitin superfamily)
VYSTKRQEIQDNIAHKVRQDLKVYHVLLQQVDVRDVYYNPEYEKAINEKKLAEQEVLRLQQVTAQKKELETQSIINKNIAIQEAEGRAKALQIEGQAISNNPQVVSLRWIEAWKAGGSQVPEFVSGGGGSQFILQMPEFAKRK